MSDLRQRLIEARWRQGVVLAPDAERFKHQEAIGFLVLNQTCDCVSPDLENEPFFELLPLMRIENVPELQNGRNPRRIHFQIYENGSVIWVSAKMAEIEMCERSRYAEFVISPDLAIGKASHDGLMAWRAARYIRPAFPENFELAIKKPLGKVKKAIKKHEGSIDSILLSLDPFDELEEDEQYELQFRLMVKPEVLGYAEEVKSLKELADKLQSLLKNCSAFDKPTCAVAALAQMNLLERRKFIDFSRYNYLSFGENDE